MDSLLVFFNALAYVVFFIVEWRRRKNFDVCVLIIALWAMTAVLCFMNYSTNWQSFPDIGILAFIYLFAVFCIFLIPFKRHNIAQKEFELTDNIFLKVLAFIFIAFAFYEIFTSLIHTQEIVVSGGYAELRNQGYVDEESVVLYDNQYQRLAKNIAGYLKPFGIAYLFMLLTQPRSKKLLVLALVLSIVIPSFYASVADASRGMIIGLMMKLLIGYLLFKKLIPQNRRRIIYAGGGVILVFFVAYLIAVTVSRFGDESRDSLFHYLGHSMLAFNDGIFYKTAQHSWGGRFFDFFVDLFGVSNFFPSASGYTHQGAFITFIGSLYLDFGFIGTILVALFGVAIIIKFFKKKKIKLSDAIMIIFYCDILAYGITVSPRNRALTWVMTFVVYYIVRFCEKRSITNKVKRYA